MSWRIVVISSIAKLELKLNYLVIKQDGNTQRIFINEIGTLIIESTAVSLTCALLSELINKKIKVIFCNEKRNPQSELISCYGSHDMSNKLKMQLSWREEIKDQVALAILKEKISRQALILSKYKLINATALLRMKEEIMIGDPNNCEGHAARTYFNSLFGMEFVREKDSIINAALNYGYAIILSNFNRSIVASGYLTQLGIFHDSGMNHFNFSSDLMEPWRVLVDELIYTSKFEKFEKEEKMKLVNLLNKLVVINNRQQTVSNAIDIYCQSIFRSLEEEDTSLIRFYTNVT